MEYPKPYKAMNVREAILVRELILMLMDLNVARKIENVYIYYTGDAWDDRYVYVQLVRDDSSDRNS